MLQNELIEQLGVKLVGASRVLGHKSALDQLGSSYTQFLYPTSSFCYDISQVSDVAGLKIFLGTLLRDYESKGLLIKG